jgi:putative transposase
MARRPRLFVVGFPYHAIQRGNNKTPIFFSDNDYLFFLEVLQEAKIKHPCFLYSYCLMPNHFHLLIEPKEKNNVSLLIKLLGAKYVRYVNKAYDRTGTLWEGRFKCALIEEELYFLTCFYYIEMNPVKAGITDLPELYRWSSYRFRAYGEKSAILDLDAWYKGLGATPHERQLRYRQLFQKAISKPAHKLVEEMTNKGGIIGCDSFKEHIQKIIGRNIIFRPPGRPKSNEK